jgi:hypothetical protein
MRASTAYFAGVGTVAVAIAAGLGGGLLLGDIMSPQGSKTAEAKRVEQRASPQPIPAMNGAAQPVPFMAATQAAATVGEPQAPPQQPKQAEPQPSQSQPQVQQASTQPAETKPAPERNAPAAAPPPAAPDDALAKARDAELKRDARRDDRRKAERRQQWGDDRQQWSGDERRMQWDERRQQWTDKRKWRQRRDDDLGDVEASVRAATEPRPLFGREPRVESRGPGFGSGRFTLFDD